MSNSLGLMRVNRNYVCFAKGVQCGENHHKSFPNQRKFLKWKQNTKFGHFGDWTGLSSCC